MLKITLGNKVLNVQFKLFRTPNFKKLSKELSDYFEKNEIQGIKIKSFELKDENFSNVIVPEEPYFEEFLEGGNYNRDLAKIGEKYGIKHLDFVYWCYHK